MSGSSNLPFNLGSKAKNLVSASATAATSLLYSGLSGSIGGSGGSTSTGSSSLQRNGSAVVDKEVEETKQKSTSLSGRYTSTTTSDTSGTTNTNTMSTNGSASHANNGSTTTGVGYSNGNSLTGTSASGGNYRLASLDRLAQRQKLYENGANNLDNVSFIVAIET
jgi:hypothetical protein